MTARLKTLLTTTILFLVALMGLAYPTEAQDPFIPEFSELAPGVWAGVRAVNPRTPVMGTATFVISNEGVVVFDGGGAALYAERVIDKIKSLTDKPVTHVVISHWHGDHNFGIYRFLEEFDNVQVVSHSFTKMVMQSKRIRYIDNNPTFIPKFKISSQKILDEDMEDGQPLSVGMRQYYEQVMADADVIHTEFNRMQISVPTITFDDKFTIRSGERTIELLYLGDGNTAGDISMWLPKEKIIATGDTVVVPLAYAFNVPPRRWSATLRAMNALEYNTLVPGHGDIQHSTKYVDMLIEVSDYVADQRDSLLAKGVSEEDAMAEISIQQYRERFVGNDPYLQEFFDGYFAKPLIAAAFKELKGIPMVHIEP